MVSYKNQSLHQRAKNVVGYIRRPLHMPFGEGPKIKKKDTDLTQVSASAWVSWGR